MLIRVYSYSLTVAAALILWEVFDPLPQIDLVLALVLITASFVAENFAYWVSRSFSVSLAFPVCLAAILLGGPALGALVAIAGAVTPEDLLKGKPPHKILFNISQLGISATIAGGAYLAVGGAPLYFEPQLYEGVWVWLSQVLITALIYTAVNTSLVVAVIKLSTKGSLKSIVPAVVEYLKGLLPLTLLGLVIAKIVAIAGLAYLILLIVPFLLSRQTFMIYQQRQAAYLSTVRSLVAAIEVKDKYTSGHTERVAVYSRALGQYLGLKEPEVQRIEWAALLHDIGKVILPTETLCKLGKLSDEEYCEIKEHPRIAAEILEEVEFLRDIIPLIAAHHERPDGKGYPLGIKGEEIPLGARIIMVADVFDAITSIRPYRETLTVDEAVQELRDSVSGHLDPECVEAFVAAINEGAIAPATALQGAGEPASA